MTRKSKAKQERKKFSCRLIQWSVIGPDEKPRPLVCPECGAEAELGLSFIGSPCYFHKRPEEIELPKEFNRNPKLVRVRSKPKSSRGGRK